jgi:hypothetical protein
MQSAYPGEALLFRFSGNRFSLSTEIGLAAGFLRVELSLRRPLLRPWGRRGCFTARRTGTTTP